MFNDYDFNELRTEEREAYKRKQALWNAFTEARERARNAYDAMQAAWLERSKTREIMNHEYEMVQCADEHQRAIWDHYHQIRKELNVEIEVLRAKSNAAHCEMKIYFRLANQSAEKGEKELADKYMEKRDELKKERDNINAKVRELCLEIKEARQEAEWHAPREFDSALQEARTNFEKAKENHIKRTGDFKYLKSERDRLQLEFEAAKKEHEQLKEEYREHLQELYSDPIALFNEPQEIDEITIDLK